MGLPIPYFPVEPGTVQQRVLVRTYSNHADKNFRTFTRSAVRGNGDTIITGLLDRLILNSGMRMVIYSAVRKGEDYKKYPYMQPDHIVPTECPFLDYEFRSDCVSITNDYGDYETVRWKRLTWEEEKEEGQNG